MERKYGYCVKMLVYLIPDDILVKLLIFWFLWEEEEEEQNRNKKQTKNWTK